MEYAQCLVIFNGGIKHYVFPSRDKNSSPHNYTVEPPVVKPSWLLTGGGLQEFWVKLFPYLRLVECSVCAFFL